MADKTEMSAEELLVRLELENLGLPIPPQATMERLAGKVAERYAQWYLDEMEERLDGDPKTSLFGMFKVWTDVLNDREAARRP